MTAFPLALSVAVLSCVCLRTSGATHVNEILVISAIAHKDVDSPIFNFIELTACTGIPDLSLYSIGFASGSTFTFPKSTSLSQGDRIYLSSYADKATMEDFLAFTFADDDHFYALTSYQLGFNAYNDLSLTRNAMVVDSYPGTSNSALIYNNGWTTRLLISATTAAPSDVFHADEWDVHGGVYSHVVPTTNSQANPPLVLASYTCPSSSLSDEILVISSVAHNEKSPIFNFVELTACTDIPDLSLYSIVSDSGRTFTFPKSKSLSQGDRIYLSSYSDKTVLEAFFAITFTAERFYVLTTSQFAFNAFGDLSLTRNLTVVDTYPGTSDGSLVYNNGWTTRLNCARPTGVFHAEEWTVHGGVYANAASMTNSRAMPALVLASYTCPTSLSATETLVISSVAHNEDSPIFNFIELTACTGIPDLSLYSIDFASGSTFTFPKSTSLSQGDRIYLSSYADKTAMETFFAMTFADERFYALEPYQLGFNAYNDLSLTRHALVVDVYPGTSNSALIYNNGWALRLNGARPSNVFKANDWIVHGGVYYANKNVVSVTNNQANPPLVLASYTCPASSLLSTETLVISSVAHNERLPIFNFVELTACTSIPELSLYSVVSDSGRIFTFPKSKSLAQGDRIYLSSYSDKTVMEAFFAITFAADRFYVLTTPQFAFNAFSDLSLTRNGLVVDTYPGTSDLALVYNNGWTARLNGATPSGVFHSDEWTVHGGVYANAAASMTDNSRANPPLVLASYTCPTSATSLLSSTKASAPPPTASPSLSRTMQSPLPPTSAHNTSDADDSYEAST